MMKWIWYLLGLAKGARHVVLEGSGYTYTDQNHDGHIVITEGEG